MYPESRERALVDQLDTERAITELTEIALELWLPLAEASVLHAAAPPPDAGAAAEQDAQWEYLVDAVLIYGISMIAANAAAKAYRAMADAPLVVADAVLPPLRFDMEGMPTRAALRTRVGGVLRRRLGINVDATERVVNESPMIRAFVSDHVNNIRGRVLDAVGRVFRRVGRINTETPDADAAREEVDAALEPDTEEWRDAADLVGQTQATSALNGALDAAARAVTQDHPDRAFEQEWVAILDSHTRLAHAEADGQRVPLGSLFTVGGEQMRWPGDPLANPDNTINCRCRMFAFPVSVQASALELLADRAREFAASVNGQPYTYAGDSHGSATMGSETTEEKTMPKFRSFTSVLAAIGEETDDGRMFASDIDLQFRDFPLPLLWQRQASGGHYDAFTVGVIQNAWVSGSQVIGTGYMLDTEEAREAMMQAEHGVTGPSVDLGDVEWELRDSNGKKITEEDWWDDPDMAVIQTVLSAKVLAATLVSTPAFGSTSITLGEEIEIGEDALVAAAPVIAMPATPAKPHAAAFANPQFTEPTYPHMTEDGVIRGHLAAWNVCHVGIQDRCVLAPHSETDYAWFHTSPPVQLADGGKVKVGRLTVGGGHAGPKLGVGPTIDHYDNVGTCFALVHVGEDEHGIWFSGIPSPGATVDQITRGLAAPLSGDWRNVSGNLELVAALSVNTPGFPLVASGATDDEGAPTSLIASLGPCDDGKNPAAVTDPVELARLIATEMRAADRREAEALAILADHDRRTEALAILSEVEG